uniref:Tc1-like transposase DDE domain-containing protein n=1 Tax=Megaselia scalaris TaxID=36166 RepID=T1H5G4_MEGSC
MEKERFSECAIMTTSSFARGSLMVWVELHNILALEVIPRRPQVFMQDNACPHAARIVRDYLNEEEILGRNCLFLIVL